MERVIGMVVPVSCNNTVHCMRQLWVLDSFMCLIGCYFLGRSKSLSIGPSQRTWLDTLLGTYWCHLHRLHLHRLYLVLCGLLCCTFPVQLLRWPLQIVCSMPPYAHLFFVSGRIWFSFPWLRNNNHLMYDKFQMYTSWPWWTSKGNFMSNTWWFIMGFPPICSEVLGSTVPKSALRAWLYFAIELTFFDKLLDLFSLDYYHDRIFNLFCWERCWYWCV